MNSSNPVSGKEKQIVKLKRVYLDNIMKGDRLDRQEVVMSHEVFHAQKMGKPEQWFLKITDDKNLNLMAYPDEFEAIVSDLFRFILGPSRAAKSRVVMENTAAEPGGIISQLNVSGFISTDDLWKNQLSSKDKKRLPFRRYYEVYVEKRSWVNSHLLTRQKGFGEILLASYVLDKADADQLSDYGLNNYGELSTIDYDCCLRTVKSEVFNINRIHCLDTIHNKNLEEYFRETEHQIGDNQFALNRFYFSQIKLLLLPLIIPAITRRHTESKLVAKKILDYIEHNILELRYLLTNSPKFRSFILRIFNIEQLINECDLFFNFEKKHDLEFLNILQDMIKDKVNNIIFHSYSLEFEQAYESLLNEIKSLESYSSEISNSTDGEELKQFSEQLEKTLQGICARTDNTQSFLALLDSKNDLMKERTNLKEQIINLSYSTSNYFNFSKSTVLLFFSATTRKQSLLQIREKFNSFNEIIEQREGLSFQHI